jgi:chromosome segregation ATPase
MGVNEANMDLLKQLEGKLQALVQQRNQFRDEAAALKAERTSHDEELHNLRRRLEDLQGEHAALQKERADVRTQVESILKMVEGLE